MKSLLMFFIMCLAIQAQAVKIVKVLDSNLFQLDDGRIVKLAGIDVPKLSHPSEFFKAAARDAVNYANINLLDRRIKVYPILNVSDKNYESVIIFKNYLFNQVNINAKYLSMGFGKYLNNTDEDLNKELLNSEKDAIENGIGIWFYGNKLTNKDTLDADLIKNCENIYSGPFKNLEYKIKRPTPLYFAIPLEILAGSGVTFVSSLGSGLLILALTWNGYGFILGAYYGMIASYLIGFPSGVYFVAKDINPDLSYWETLGFSLGVTGLTTGLTFALFPKDNNHPTRFIALLSPVIASILYVNFIAPKTLHIENTYEVSRNKIKTNRDYYNSTRIINLELIRINF